VRYRVYHVAPGMGFKFRRAEPTPFACTRSRIVVVGLCCLVTLRYIEREREGEKEGEREREKKKRIKRQFTYKFQPNHP